MEEKNKRKIFLTFAVAALAILFVLIIWSVVSIMRPDVSHDPEREDNFMVDPRDGERYGTVTIGDRDWFVENLRVGEAGPAELILAQSKDDWSAAGPEGIPVYAAYLNDNGNTERYGYLYNWHAAKLPDLCPEGWSVPSDDDWHELEKYLSEEGFPCQPRRTGSLSCEPAGTMMKVDDQENGTAQWNDNTCMSEGIECSGFNALPGGSRYTSGTFFGIGSQSYFWSSSQNEEGESLFRNLRESGSGVLRNESSAGLGMSVRCIKDR